jgi:hypothetical protein
MIKTSVRINKHQAREKLGALVKAQGPTTTKKIAMLIIGYATQNLVRSRGSNRSGLSRKSGSGQYAHTASQRTIRSFRADPSGDGWRITLGGAAYPLEYGRGPHLVPISELRQWAAVKFPGLGGNDLQRFLINLQRRIKRNGLRPTRFFSNAIKEVRSNLRKVKHINQLPSEGVIQAQIDALRQRIEVAALPRVPRRND